MIGSIFNVFSRRKENEAAVRKPLTPGFRQRTLMLLRDAGGGSLYAEFMAALEDYRHRKFGDCVTKCNASYESVMKVICGQKRFGYSERDSTAKLLRTIMAQTQMEGFWETPLMVVSTLRNKLSSAHGAGENAKVVPEHVARYAMNMTASAIVFLNDQAYSDK